jgi:hypothetical protein
MALGTPTPTLIHQGPGWAYFNVCAPAHSKRHLIGSDGTPTQPAWAGGMTDSVGMMVVDSNGNIQECITGGTADASTPPTWGTTVGATAAESSGTGVWKCVALAPAYLFAGALEGTTDLDIGPKIEETTADQETLPIDAVVTGEVSGLSLTLKESDCAKLRLLVPHGTYASGSDSALPSGAQSYEEIAWGGLPPLGIPQFGVLFISKRKDQASKFVVSQLYKAYQKTAIKLPFQRGKETTYKIDFAAIADLYRPVGDRGGKIYRQT